MVCPYKCTLIPQLCTKVHLYWYPLRKLSFKSTGMAMIIVLILAAISMIEATQIIVTIQCYNHHLYRRKDTILGTTLKTRWIFFFDRQRPPCRRSPKWNREWSAEISVLPPDETEGRNPPRTQKYAWHPNILLSRGHEKVSGWMCPYCDKRRWRRVVCHTLYGAEVMDVQII